MTSKKNKSLITLFLAFVMLFAIGFLVANNNKEFMTVAYVERDKGGAAVCLKKAEKKGINIKNIALEEE